MNYGVESLQTFVPSPNVAQSSTGSVDTQDVVGSFTDQAVTVINNSGGG